MSEVDEIIKKFQSIPKIEVDAFGEDRGFIKGHAGKEGGSYRPARRGLGFGNKRRVGR